MDIQVLYFDGCPSWRTAKQRLSEALALMGRGNARVELIRVQSEAEARASQFAGSPTILVDGGDLFPGAPVFPRLDLLAVRNVARTGRIADGRGPGERFKKRGM